MSAEADLRRLYRGIVIVGQRLQQELRYILTTCAEAMFGAPAPFSFGAPAPAPAPAPFSFGVPAPAPSPFTFGSPAPASGAFSFGAPAPTPAPFSFGAPAPAPFTFGAPAPAPFSFGAPAPAPSFGGFSFSAPAPVPAPAPAPAAVAAAAAVAAIAADKQDVLVAEIVSMLNKYAAVDGGSLVELRQMLRALYKSEPATNRFKAVAFNIRDSTTAYLKPPMLTQEEWDLACAEHATDEATMPPQPLIPVVLDGFEGLNRRVDAQDAQAHEFLKAAERLLAATKTVQSELSRGRDALDRLRARHDALVRRLLGVAAKVEVLAVRQAPENSEERSLRALLGRLRAALQSSGDVLMRIATLEQAQISREEASEWTSASVPRRSAQLGDAIGDLSGVQRQLETQSRGVEQLIAVVTKDARDMRIVRDKIDGRR